MAEEEESPVVSRVNDWVSEINKHAKNGEHFTIRWSEESWTDTSPPIFECRVTIIGRTGWILLVESATTKISSLKNMSAKEIKDQAAYRAVQAIRDVIQKVKEYRHLEWMSKSLPGYLEFEPPKKKKARVEVEKDK